MRISLSFILAVLTATIATAHELPSQPSSQLLARSFGRRHDAYTKSGSSDTYAKGGHTKHHHHATHQPPSAANSTNVPPPTASNATEADSYVKPPCDEEDEKKSPTEKKDESTPPPVPAPPPKQPDTYSKQPVENTTDTYSKQPADTAQNTSTAVSPTSQAAPPDNSSVPTDSKASVTPSSNVTTPADSPLTTTTPSNLTAIDANNTSNLTSPDANNTSNLTSSDANNSAPIDHLNPSNSTNGSLDSNSSQPGWASNGQSAYPSRAGSLGSPAGSFSGGGPRGYGNTNGQGSRYSGSDIVPAYYGLSSQAREITQLLNNQDVSPQVVATKLSAFFGQFKAIVAAYGPTCSFCSHSDFKLDKFQSIAIQFSQTISTWLTIIQKRWSTTFLQICPWFATSGSTVEQFLQFAISAGVPHSEFSVIFTPPVVQSSVNVFWGTTFESMFY